MKNFLQSLSHGIWPILAMSLAPTAWAQSTPSAEQMVEQLKAPPRTRGLRNLTVEAANPATSVTNAATSTPNADASPAAVGAPAPAPVAQPEAKPTLSLLIQFDLNSARVKPESQQALANLAQALQSAALQGSKFAVEGHTDATGRSDHNLRLSQQRADAVRDILVTQGVTGQRLQTAGKGSSELANPAAPSAAENRRVRIVNLD